MEQASAWAMDAAFHGRGVTQSTHDKATQWREFIVMVQFDHNLYLESFNRAQRICIVGMFASAVRNKTFSESTREILTSYRLSYQAPSKVWLRPSKPLATPTRDLTLNARLISIYVDNSKGSRTAAPVYDPNKRYQRSATKNS
jgi:hypothetical protein